MIDTEISWRTHLHGASPRETPMLRHDRMSVRTDSTVVQTISAPSSIESSYRDTYQGVREAARKKPHRAHDDHRAFARSRGYTVFVRGSEANQCASTSWKSATVAALIVMTAIVGTVLVGKSIDGGQGGGFSSSHSVVVGTQMISVGSGDNLTTIAERIAPSEPSERVAELIREMNQLPSSSVNAGQLIVAPEYAPS